ncbi:hypothetical protein C8J57DRAFT_1291666 [Mycena rebaudengoi]|nr:hypothetical protein C8J57DRAFT_1291666 [Mycena rebaudengoi]
MHELAKIYYPGDTLDPGYELRSFAAPSIEDVLNDTPNWNANWERESKALSDARYAEFLALTNGCLRLQIALIQDIFTFRNKGFDEKWIYADPSVRAKHVLDALTNVCSAAHNLHHARRLCGELSVPSLSRSGHRLLGLLKSIIPEDLTAPPTTVRHFSNPEWEALRVHVEESNRGDEEKFHYQAMLIIRTKLICHVLQATFRSFLGLGVPVIQLARVHAVKKRFQGIQTRTLVPPGAKLVRTGCHLKTCPNGMHGNNDIPEEKQFLRCKDCWMKLQREVKYCDRECQRLDWKPSHKAICGKPFDFNTIETLATPAAAPPSRFSPIVGPATGGFVRSTALLYMISQLSLRPNADYLVMHAPTEDTEIDFVHSGAKTLFRTFREKALTTGDREAIAVLAHAICWWASLGGYGGPVRADMVIKQLRVEFSFDALKAAVIEMEKRQNTDPLSRPPFLFKMDPTQWMDFAYRHRIVQNQIKFHP